MRQPVEHFVEINGINLCWFEWGKATAEPTILLVHATGFHARCWDQVVKHLGDRHVISVDQRNHGRSDKTVAVEWKQYAADLVEFIQFLNLPPIILVGHSMGGYCATSAMLTISERVASALLVDPVIFEPSLYTVSTGVHQGFLNEADEHPIARRRNHFVDANAMFENFEGRGSYAKWTTEALRDYCEFGLNPDTNNGGFKLACPPELEASIYMTSQGQPMDKELAEIDVPVTVLRAEQRTEERTTLDFTKSPTWSELANQFGNGRDVYLPDLTHFMPMQAPELVADYILGYLEPVK